MSASRAGLDALQSRDGGEQFGAGRDGESAEMGAELVSAMEILPNELLY